MLPFIFVTPTGKVEHKKQLSLTKIAILEHCLILNLVCRPVVSLVGIHVHRIFVYPTNSYYDLYLWKSSLNEIVDKDRSQENQSESSIVNQSLSVFISIQ